MTNEQLTELVTMLAVNGEQTSDALNKITDLITNLFKHQRLLKERQNTIIERIEARIDALEWKERDRE